MGKSASYKPAECCGDDCVLLDCYEDQPCWGETVVIDEDWWGDDWSWVHACEGHRRHRDGVPYLHEPVRCPQCDSIKTKRTCDGPSGYCRECGATWAEHIRITIKIDKEGEQADV